MKKTAVAVAIEKLQAQKADIDRAIAILTSAVADTPTRKPRKKKAAGSQGSSL